MYKIEFKNGREITVPEKTAIEVHNILQESSGMGIPNPPDNIKSITTDEDLIVINLSQILYLIKM